MKSGELFFFTAFTAITAFLTKIHRIHRISYENLPKNLDPGVIDDGENENCFICRTCALHLVVFEDLVFEDPVYTYYNASVYCCFNTITSWSSRGAVVQLHGAKKTKSSVKL